VSDETAARFGQPRTAARWGKAGVRLNAEEIEQADRHRRAETNKQRLRAEAEHRKAHADWKRGLVQPWRITHALDARGLNGPDVDEKCGVQEPTVDNWEAGIVYPSWEQLCKLAELCGVTPALFMFRGFKPLRPGETSLRFHMDVERLAEPVMRFTSEAVAAAVAGEGACPTCRRTG